MGLTRKVTTRLTLLYESVRRLFLTVTADADHVGPRAIGHRLDDGRFPVYRKRFSASTEGRDALAREVLARDVFGTFPWMVPILDRGDDWITMPMLPDEARLDRVAPTLSPEQRQDVAVQAMGILLDLHAAGYAHRDFHGRNAFWLDGQLFIVDYESLGEYPAGGRPPFPRSYDVTGEGLESPHRTNGACYSKADSDVALGQLLGVPAEEALSRLRASLKDDLRTASLTFQARNRRHTCNAQRIYNSFDLEWLGVHPEEAQRDSARRLENFGVTDADIRDRTVLDLGSNIGGMLFELQKFGPRRCVGVEYDAEKVRAARRVAAYNGLNALTFVQGDIDALAPDDVGGSFDIVMCLAIVEHLARPKELYVLLGQLTGSILLFEGNANTDPAEVQAELESNGFPHVEHLGSSDDDCRPQNNRRPIFRALKRT